MDSRIEPCVSDELFVVIETAHIPNFSQEVDNSYVSDAFNGFEDLKFVNGTLKAHIDQDRPETFELFLEQKELRDFLRVILGVRSLLFCVFAPRVLDHRIAAKEEQRF